MPNSFMSFCIKREFMFRFIVASRMFGGLESEYSEAEGQD